MGASIIGQYPIPGDSGRRCVVEIGHLKNQSHPGSQMNYLAYKIFKICEIKSIEGDDLFHKKVCVSTVSLTAHEAELLAVIKDSVEVLNPGGVHGTVQHHPPVLLHTGGGHVPATVMG